MWGHRVPTELVIVIIAYRSLKMQWTLLQIVLLQHTNGEFRAAAEIDHNMWMWSDVSAANTFLVRLAPSGKYEQFKESAEANNNTDHIQPYSDLREKLVSMLWPTSHDIRTVWTVELQVIVNTYSRYWVDTV